MESQELALTYLTCLRIFSSPAFKASNIVPHSSCSGLAHFDSWFNGKN
jgi:hypothetical protein